jgi:hypothetical protein
MAESGGYWLNLAEAEKLTQNVLVPGIIEENIRRGGILDRLPLAQAAGTQIDWNRENAEREAREIAAGSLLTWTNNATYTQKGSKLKILYDQTPLDNFVSSVYGTINNYEAAMLKGLRKGMMRRLEDRIIYGDTTFSTNSLEYDGLHAWAYDNDTSGGTRNIDEAGALSLANMRALEDEMKLGVDFILMSYQLARRIDAFYQEAGSVVSARSSVGSFIWDKNEIGKRVPFWNGIEIVRSDYMVAEQAATGEGSDAMAKYTSGTKEYSIFFVKMGQVMLGEGGVTLAFGGDAHEAGEIFKTVFFPQLENYDASGLRLVSYAGTLCGSSFGVGRIYGITDVAVTE